MANTHDWVLFFTDQGRVFKDQVYSLPEMGRYAKGRALVNYLDLQKGERVNAVLPHRDLDDDRAILFATGQGRVKRTSLQDFKNIRRTGIIAIQLRDGDSLIGTKLVGEDEEVVLLTAQGQAIRFPVNEARTMGRTAGGVKGISLRGEDHVVGMAIVDPEAALLTVCERGYAKRTLFSEYPTKHRGGLGVKNLSPEGLERNGPVVAARPVLDGDEVILITEGGQSIRMQVSTEQFRTMGRSTGGVKAIEVPSGDRLVSMAWVRPEENGDEDEAAEGPEGGDGTPAGEGA